MRAIPQVVRDVRAAFCNECGKCASHCPLSLRDGTFSPRGLLTAVVQGRADDVLDDRRLWRCLTCGQCEAFCPMDVRYAAFARGFRAVARDGGTRGRCTHGGALQALMEWMANHDVRQDRLGWVDVDLEIAQTGDTVYFVGCLPYFDAFFEDIGAESLNIARASVRILNHLGVVPVVMADERCCGHDLLWEGDEEGFGRLAAHNVAALKATGATRVIASCAECVRTLRLDYAEQGLAGVDVVHMAEFLAEQLEEGRLTLAGPERVVTYQDPCRLGRHLGVTEAPRAVMSSIGGTELREMSGSGKDATCCGTSAWTQCDATARALQVERIAAARAAGADTLVTACPKCAIHYKCTMAGNGLHETVEIKDLEEIVAESL